MFNTFNMGIGMIVAVAKENADKTVETLKAYGEDAVVLGELVEGNDGVIFE
ncbi:phosphoribosylformylglycinamidine cyclo-ligase [Eubacterium sp. CAG:581]|nr:phosphoribosylformylglycinamidine cyclo-ligase [Eubacterium sp. CAG:581]